MVEKSSLKFLLEKADKLDIKYLTKKGKSLFSKSKGKKMNNKKRTNKKKKKLIRKSSKIKYKK